MKPSHYIKVVACWLLAPVALIVGDAYFGVETPDALPLGIALAVCLLGLAVLTLLVLAALTLLENH